MLSKYRKTIVAVIGAVVGWSNIVIQSAPQAITASEWQTGVVLVLTAAGVYGVTNKPEG
jgi:hypothetical protein